MYEPHSMYISGHTMDNVTTYLIKDTHMLNMLGVSMEWWKHCAWFFSFPLLFLHQNASKAVTLPYIMQAKHILTWFGGLLFKFFYNKLHSTLYIDTILWSVACCYKHLPLYITITSENMKRKRPRPEDIFFYKSEGQYSKSVNIFFPWIIREVNH